MESRLRPQVPIFFFITGIYRISTDVGVILLAGPDASIVGGSAEGSENVELAYPTVKSFMMAYAF